jgi:hypothetical protein
MKITMLRNAARSYGCELVEGQTGDVAKDMAERLISAGIAVVVNVPEKPVKAVAKAPEITADSKESK